MIKRLVTTATNSNPRQPLSLKQSYRLLARMPLGCASDHELERISDQIFELNNHHQIAALLGRINHR